MKAMAAWYLGTLGGSLVLWEAAPLWIAVFGGWLIAAGAVLAWPSGPTDKAKG